MAKYRVLHGFISTSTTPTKSTWISTHSHNDQLWEVPDDEGLDRIGNGLAHIAHIIAHPDFLKRTNLRKRPVVGDEYLGERFSLASPGGFPPDERLSHVFTIYASPQNPTDIYSADSIVHIIPEHSFLFNLHHDTLVRIFGGDNFQDLIEDSPYHNTRNDGLLSIDARRVLGTNLQQKIRKFVALPKVLKRSVWKGLNTTSYYGDGFVYNFLGSPVFREGRPYSLERSNGYSMEQYALQKLSEPYSATDSELHFSEYDHDSKEKQKLSFREYEDTKLYATSEKQKNKKVWPQVYDDPKVHDDDTLGLSFTRDRPPTLRSALLLKTHPGHFKISYDLFGSVTLDRLPKEQETHYLEGLVKIRKKASLRRIALGAQIFEDGDLDLYDYYRDFFSENYHRYEKGHEFKAHSDSEIDERIRLDALSSLFNKKITFKSSDLNDLLKPENRTGEWGHLSYGPADVSAETLQTLESLEDSEEFHHFTKSANPRRWIMVGGNVEHADLFPDTTKAKLLDFKEKKNHFGFSKSLFEKAKFLLQFHTLKRDKDSWSSSYLQD